MACRLRSVILILVLTLQVIFICLVWIHTSYSDELRRLAKNCNGPLPNCSSLSSLDGGPISVNSQPISMDQVEKLFNNSNIGNGGHWAPTDCLPQHRVAVLVPYRNRDSHLPIFLRHMHAFLQAQKLDYRIHIVEQTSTSKFNRGMLLNVGIVESNKIYDWHCYMLHDVDLLPEDSRNLYTCPWSNPRHMAVAHSGHGYELIYPSYFGGVSAMTRVQIEKTNGFSNVFFGWGGEDDDSWNRVQDSGYKIGRYPAEIARYKALSHKEADPSPKRFQLVKFGKSRYQNDGISKLRYILLRTDLRKLYTRFLVEIDEQSVLDHNKRL